ncbi:MAG: hypothetical protein LBF75_04720 [Treponema sp.]|nr:hypothetical protein [Treponema sp.]
MNFDAPLSKVEWKTIALVNMSNPEVPSPEGPLRSYSAIAQWYGTIYEVGKGLSDRRYGRILRYVHEYVHKGVKPNADEPLSKVEWKTLALVIPPGKPEEDSHETLPNPKPRRKIGAPFGNKNRNGGNNSESIPESIEINSESIPESIEINMHDHLHLHVHDHVAGILENLNIASQKLGFSIQNPRSLIKKFSKSDINPQWLSSPSFNFFDFTVFWFKTHSEFAKKSRDDLRNLFITATSWDDLRKEYPIWREKQEQEALNRQKKLQKKAIRETYPPVCPQCSALMQGNTCPNCKGFYSFNEATMKYVFNPTLQFDGITHQFMRILEEKHTQQAATSDPSEKVASG